MRMQTRHSNLVENIFNGFRFVGIVSLFTISMFMLSTANAATIEWDFDNTADTGAQSNITLTVDSNDFGSGVTVSDLECIQAGSDRTVRVEDHQVEWGITLASPAASASFTITIPSNIVVSLSSLAFDYGFDDTQNNKVTPSYNLTLSHGSATPSSASLGKVPDTETWTNETAVLSGLSHLSGTNITFTWTFAIQENLSNWNRRHLLDNIVLTGTAIEGGVVAWDFDDESNQYGDVALTNAPDVNTFTGNGVTVSGLFMEGGKAGHATMGVYIADKSGTDTKRAEWSVNNDHPMPDGLMETASFTVTIPAGISLALTTLQYDHGFYEPSGLNTLEPYVNLSVSVGSASPNYNDFGSDTPGSAPDIPAGDNWERNLQSTLTGMGALINTTVTFTWTFDDSENRGHPDRRHLLDNIELWGVLTVLPKGTLILVQ